MSPLLLTVVAVSLFILSYFSFLLCEKKHNGDSSEINLLFQPSSFFIVLGFLGCLSCLYIVPNKNDILIPISFSVVSAVFVSSCILSMALSICKNKVLQFLFLSVICSINILILPDNISLSHGILPVYAEKGILIFFWILFTWFYNILNNVDGVLPLQSLSLTIGLILMYIIGVMPELYGGWTGIFTAMLLSLTFFNNYPAMLVLNNKDCRLIGFFMGWLILLASIEGNLSCALILSMYYIYEFITAVIKKLSFQKRFKNLEENTFYNQLSVMGVSPKNICEFIAKINLMLMLLAGFQIYAPNEYTMVLIAFFAVFWMISRAISPQNKRQNMLLSGSILLTLFKSSKKKKSK